MQQQCKAYSAGPHTNSIASCAVVLHIVEVDTLLNSTGKYACLRLPSGLSYSRTPSCSSVSSRTWSHDAATQSSTCWPHTNNHRSSCAVVLHATVHIGGVGISLIWTSAYRLACLPAAHLAVAECHHANNHMQQQRSAMSAVPTCWLLSICARANCKAVQTSKTQLYKPTNTDAAYRLACPPAALRAAAA
jgi:hypothetical protein